MRLLEFQIKNYRSIIDTGIIKLSVHDNVTVLAGQNESGKSSILQALNDFQIGEFAADSLPFTTESKEIIQSVSCKYKIERINNFYDSLSELLKKDTNPSITSETKILDEKKIKQIEEFTLTQTKDNGIIQFTIDNNTLSILKSSILDKPIDQSNSNEISQTSIEKEKYILLDEKSIKEVVKRFINIIPKFIYFDDFCELLPNNIYISALKEKIISTKGYRAVRNLENILSIDFVSKNEEVDSVRRSKEDSENEDLSIDFQKDWGQRIHGENTVLINYDFQKRSGTGENGSYINFYVSTKPGQRLPPQQRSKGLIWFLSLWLELKAQNTKTNDLILLLDEPDQHLHVKAQKDILKLINKLSISKNLGKSKGNGDQIIYATHSPYLIEVENLNRIKLVFNSEDQGTKIEEITTSKIDTVNKRDALQPVSASVTNFL